jgi:RNA polymerase sigma-70 factor (ECF subfamily)
LQAFSENEYKNEEWEVVSSFEDKLVSQDDVKKRFDAEYETAILNNALNNLDEDSREIIFMKYIEWFSYEHISVILWQQEANLRQRLFRALKKLKVLLDWLE